MTTILCIAGDPADAASLEGLLEQLGYAVVLAPDGDPECDLVADPSFAAVLVVCQQPDQLGLKLLGRLNRRRRRAPIIVLAGDASLEHAVFCMRSGAADYLPKPVRGDTLGLALEHARAQAALQADQATLARAAEQAQTDRRLVGRSAAMQELRLVIALVAPTDAAVLIEGESGTGKELVARALHEQSRRARMPFITINCAAVPEGLVESTLFGHEKGAFTGATARMPGVFERADGGTLFLDEISEMRLDLQAKLLRVLQGEEYERVGGRQMLRSDVRILASSNRKLIDELDAGRFRVDLYHRLHVLPIQTPALRERPEDIPDLVECFLRESCATLGVPVPTVPVATMEFLRLHPWPGNVRELRNAVHRGLILSSGSPLEPAHFRLVTRASRSPETSGAARPADAELPLNLAELEALAIERALEQANGHRANAARLLGISERTLRNRLNNPLAAPLPSGRIGRPMEILSA